MYDGESYDMFTTECSISAEEEQELTVGVNEKKGYVVSTETVSEHALRTRYQNAQN